MTHITITLDKPDHPQDNVNIMSMENYPVASHDFRYYPEVTPSVPVYPDNYDNRLEAQRRALLTGFAVTQTVETPAGVSPEAGRRDPSQAVLEAIGSTAMNMANGTQGTLQELLGARRSVPAPLARTTI